MSKGKLQEKLLPNEEGIDRRDTFANDDAMQRTFTFTRAFTFDGAALQRQVSTPFEGLKRTITQVGNHFDPDAQFTTAVIQDFNNVAAQGPEGDVPYSSGFARTKKFWKLIFYLCLVAAFMGIASVAFMNLADEVPKRWTKCDFQTDVSCGDFYNGKTYFVLIPAAGGFIIGLIRWVFSYPSNLPGIFKDIQSFHVDPKWAPLTYLISGMSLASGATLGPEQALGNLGGGIGYFVTEHVEFEDEEYDKLFVLGGMCSALGALFPSPLLGALMFHELGEPPKSYMESTTILTIAACIAFIIYYSLIGATYLEYISDDTIYISLAWNSVGYEAYMIWTGVGVGIVSGFICIMILLSIGICKQIFNRIRMKLAHNTFLKEVVPPIIGGLIIGTVNWALPATIGNGNQEFTYFINFTRQGLLSQKLLLCTGFARMVLLGVSMNCGFVGGIIFPFLTIGCIAGNIMYLNYPYLPQGLCFATFMVAVPSGVIPMPFTMACLVVFLFYFVSGSGFFKKMVLQQQARAAAEAGTVIAKPVDSESDKESIQAQKEAEEFAMKQYLGNKRSVVNS